MGAALVGPIRPVGRGELVGEDAVDVARGVEHAEDLDAVVRRAVEDQVVPEPRDPADSDVGEGGSSDVWGAPIPGRAAIWA
jgi:hypothetical protein